jgi:hypothetical protein
MKDVVAKRARPEHLLSLYADEDGLAATVAKFLGDGIAAGDEALAVITAEHRAAVSALLERSGVDVVGACEAEQLVFIDARATLSQITSDGALDAALFESVVAPGVIERVERNRGTRQVRLYGEMVDLLWQRGARQDALRLEELWNVVLRRHPLLLCCSYAARHMHAGSAFVNVCSLHTHMVDEHGHRMRVEGVRP